jgi:hypothetical protein
MNLLVVEAVVTVGVAQGPTEETVVRVVGLVVLELLA